MSVTESDFIFQGLDGEECEDFVFWIIRRAKQESKLNDDSWIASLAMSSMSKGALRWYIELEPEVQESWRLLRRALMAKYPAPEERGTQYRWREMTLPTPAAAPPLLNPEGLYATPSPQADIVGYVKIVCTEKETLDGYLNTFYCCTQGLTSLPRRKAEPIKISFSPGERGYFTATPMTGKSEKFFLSKNPKSYKEFSMLVLSDVSPEDKAFEVSSEGKPLRPLWSLSTGNPRALSVMEDTGARTTRLTPIVNAGCATLGFVTDLEAFRADFYNDATQYPTCRMEIEIVE